VKLLSFTGGMKPEQASGPAKEVAVEMHEAMTLEELKEAIKEKEEEAQKLYDVAYDLFVVSMELYSMCLCGVGGREWGGEGLAGQGSCLWAGCSGGQQMDCMRLS
jgi:hypothetical protein